MLDGIPFIGGSADDNLKFNETYIYCDGVFVSDATVFATFYTTHQFKIFKTQHFLPMEKEKMVITEADPERLIVHGN
ncbi:MAG: hypothetical protein IME94_01565 [Proteobacteria bacterium]|nr:hypothetical protein [Pseudomonadota bacterium]